jgi:hypothetical protein
MWMNGVCGGKVAATEKVVHKFLGSLSSAGSDAYCEGVRERGDDPPRTPSSTLGRRGRHEQCAVRTDAEREA